MKPLTKSLIMMAIVISYCIITFLTILNLNPYLGIGMIIIGFLLLLEKVSNKEDIKLIIKQDKANHFIVGAGINALTIAFLPPAVAFGICFGVAAGKEILDRKHGSSNLYDFLWTCLGGTFTMFVYYLAIAA